MNAQPPNSGSQAFSYNTTYFRKHFRSRLYASYRHVRNSFIIKKLKLFKPGGSLLEIGFGDDSFIKLCRDDFSVYGVDVAQWAIDNLPSDYSKSRFTLCDVSREPIPFARKFDVIILLNTLEHVSDAPAAMEHIAQALVPGGILVLFLPTRSNWLSRMQYFKYDVPEHTYRPSVDDLLKLSAGTGLFLRKEYSGNFLPTEIAAHEFIENFCLYLGYFQKRVE